MAGMTRAGIRPEIQALRAVAASMVVLYHLWPGRLRGGYAGVDVFFVISGFLITSHLLRELTTTETVRLTAFWSRRARRLLPAAYLVIAVAVVVMLAGVPQLVWAQNFREMLAASAYFENWQLAHDAVDYLAQSNDPTAVQHYWTLSVEEQFYILWPILLLGVWSLARRRRCERPRFALGVVVAMVTLVSFGYSLWLTSANPATAYFVTPARVWEFGVGALLGCVATRLPSVGDARPGWAALLWAGIAALVATSFWFTGGTPFPGWAALLPVLGAAAVITAGAPRGRLSPLPLLELAPVQWLGEISYALYLWHWPLIVLGPYLLGHPLGLAGRAVVLFLSIGLAFLSTRFVERPVREWRGFRTLRPIWTLSVAATVAGVMVAGTLVGLDTANARIAQQMSNAEALVASSVPCLGAAAMDRSHPCHDPALDHVLVPAPAAAQQDVPADTHHCFDDDGQDALVQCSFGDLSDASIPHVALLGDSHAQMYLAPLEDLARQKKITLQVQMKGSCPWEAPPPSRNIQGTDEPHCVAFRSRVAIWLHKVLPSLDLIITTSRVDLMPGTPQEKVHDLDAAWDVAGRAGVPVVAIVDNPLRMDAPTTCLSGKDVKSLTPRTCAARRTAVLGSRFEPTRKAARKAVNARALDLTDFFCGPTWCPAAVGGITIYRDISHMTKTYAATLAPYFIKRLEGTGLLTKNG